MTKIITYTDKKGGFSRRADGAEMLLKRKKVKPSLLKKNAYMQSKNWMILLRMDGRFCPLPHTPQIQVLWVAPLFC